MPVPGAAVTLRHNVTGLVRKTLTDPKGTYDFFAVPVRQNFILEVEAQGFQKSGHSGITLLVNQKLQVDAVNLASRRSPLQPFAVQRGRQDPRDVILLPSARKVDYRIASLVAACT